MSDKELCERLRNPAYECLLGDGVALIVTKTMQEAADRIEQLEAENAGLKEQEHYLRQSLSEVEQQRRELCGDKAKLYGKIKGLKQALEPFVKFEVYLRNRDDIKDTDTERFSIPAGAYRTARKALEGGE